MDNHTLINTFEAEGFHSVEFTLSSPNIAYAGSDKGVYRSEDGGHTWRRVSGGDQGWGPPGVRAGFPIDIQVDPRDSNRIFINNYGGGNFLSEDGGQSWTAASAGYTGAQVRAIAVDPTQSSVVYAAARSGIFTSNNGGNQWVGLNFPPVSSLEWTAVAIDPSSSQHLLAATNWGGVILESLDGGYNWRVVQQNIKSRTGWRAIVFAPSNPSIIYAGTAFTPSGGVFGNEAPAAGVYVSLNSGATWHEANSSISQDAHVSSLAIDSKDSQRVYAGTTNHGVLMTSNGGQNWSAMNQGLPETWVGSPMVLSIALHPTNSNILLVGLWHGGVYQSDNSGETWHMVSPGLNPEATITDIVFDPVNPRILYVSDILSGVYRSTDGGHTWQQINNALRTRAVNKLAISSDGLHLYAATEGEGVYRLDISGEPPAMN